MHPSASPSGRPKAALVFLIAPIVAGVALVGATFGWFWAVRNTSGQAEGDWAVVRFEAPCDVSTAMAARLDDLGLEHRRDGEAWVVRMPGMDDDLAHVPAMLARPGRLDVQVGGAPHPARVTEVGVQLAFSGTPITLLNLVEPVPERARVDVRVDGEAVEIEQATGQELQLASRAGDSVTALRTATDRAVTLRHPLDCAATVVSAQWVH